MAEYRAASRRIRLDPGIRPRTPPPRAIVILTLLLIFAGSNGHAQTMEAPGSAPAARQDIEAVLSGRDYQRQFPVTPAPQPAESRPVTPEPVAPDFQFETEKAGPLLPLFDMFRFVAWILIAAGVLYLAYLLVRKVRRDRKPPAPEEQAPVAEETATPASRLADVEQLARDGALADAVHLLLLLFIEDIREKQRTAVQPALTSREIVAAVSLPQSASASLAFIVGWVERTRFGGMEIDRDTFEQCLEGYRNSTLRQATGR